jgi:hypothetical protein
VVGSNLATEFNRFQRTSKIVPRYFSESFRIKLLNNNNNKKKVWNKRKGRKEKENYFFLNIYPVCLAATDGVLVITSCTVEYKNPLVLFMGKGAGRTHRADRHTIFFYSWTLEVRRRRRRCLFLCCCHQTDNENVGNGSSEPTTLDWRSVILSLSLFPPHTNAIYSSSSRAK